MKLIVIGASAGGYRPIVDVLRPLPANLNAAVIVVRHLAPSTDDLLTDLLNAQTPMQVEPALDAVALKPGRVYVAQSDTQVRFQAVTDSASNAWTIGLAVSEKDTAHRSVPTIDVTLDAAAPLFGSDLIAVILSGRLDDGTEGAISLAKYGGTTIVQQPLDAAYESMPFNVIRRDTPAHIVNAEAMPALLLERCGRLGQ